MTAPTTGAPLRLLLVEDNPGDARLVTEALKDVRRLELERAGRLDEGIERLGGRAIDAVLLDLGLPDSQGIDTLRAFLQKAPATPVIVLTGLDDEETGYLAIQEGAQDYLTKGRMAEYTLMRTIRYAIERTEAQVAFRRMNDMLRAIRCVDDLIVRERDGFRLVDSICESLVKLEAVSCAWIVLTDAKGLVTHGSSAGMKAEEDPAALAVGGTGIACLSLLGREKALFGESLKELCETCPLGEFGDRRMPSVCRLYRNGRTRGIVGFSFGDDKPITEEQRSLITEIADDIAFALDGIEEEERRERNRQLLRLRVNIHEFSASHELPSILRESLSMVEGFTGSEAGLCYFRNGETGPLALAAASPGAEARKLAQRSSAAGVDCAELARKVIESRQPMIANDPGLAGFAGSTPFKRFIALPVSNTEGIETVLILGDKAANYTEDDLEAVKFLSDVVLTIAKIKLGEQGLHRSEEKFRILFQNAADVILFLENLPSGEKMIREGNEATFRLLGYTRDELINRPLSVVEDGEDPEAPDPGIDGAANRRLESRQSIRETRFRAKDGSARRFEYSLSTLREGSRSMGIMICRDITERKLLERLEKTNAECLEILNDQETLREQTSLLMKTISKNTGIKAVGVRLAEGDGRFPIFESSGFPDPSPAADSPDAAEAGPLWERIAEGDGFWTNRASTDVARTETLLDPRLEVFSPAHQSAALIPMRFGKETLGFLQLADERPDLLSVQEVRLLERVCRNFALSMARRQAEDLLKESERRYRTESQFVKSMLQASPDIVLVIEAETGRLIRWNESFVEYSGHAGDDVEAIRFEGLFSDASRETAAEAVSKAVLSGRAIVELPLESNSGTSVPFEFSMSPIPGEGRDETLLIVLGRDVTERVQNEAARKKLEEQLLVSQKMEAIGKLAGGVAHDFNNLLAVIISYSEFALREAGENKKLREDIEEISATADRAADLTRQLLAFSRKQVLQPSLIDLNATAKGLEKMLRRIIGEDVELKLILGGQRYAAFVDPGQIEQVIMNLVVNARDAMPHGGKLTIETASAEITEEEISLVPSMKPGRYVLLAVTDTGMGMDKETKDRIFEPFFTTKPLGKGTGLGLSVVYGIVKQSGGNISVYSELGHGTTFKVYLPRAEWSGAGDSPSRAEPAVYSGNETILVVDDEEGIRRAAMRSLEEAGYTALGAKSEADALETISRYGGRIHCLLTDLIMPGGDGKSLARNAAKALPDIKVVYMSGYTDNAAVLLEIVDEGADFIQKPFSSGNLTKMIRKALDSPRRGPDVEAPVEGIAPGRTRSSAPAPSPLPPKLSARLVAAVSAARYDDIIEFIGEIESEYPQQAESLSRMAEQYDYEGMLALARGD
jgi:PAS domain S-box-containing protein